MPMMAKTLLSLDGFNNEIVRNRTYAGCFVAVPMARNQDFTRTASPCPPPRTKKANTGLGAGARIFRRELRDQFNEPGR